MKRIGLVVHCGSESALECAAQAAVYLTNMGASVTAEEEAAGLLRVPSFEGAETPEAVLSLGGDGTLLRGAQWALAWNVPLMGVNLGHVGFLTEAEPERLQDILNCLLREDYVLEERALLEVRLQEARWLALNDVVVSRGGYARLITLDALVDGETAGRYVADGVIVATPTGSTGYSLSAGGPIVSPHVDCMVITPICAHSLQHRPCVVPGNAFVCLVMCGDTEQHASLQVDGQSRADLLPGAQVEIRRAQQPIRLIRTRPAPFFQLVRDKLTEWSR